MPMMADRLRALAPMALALVFAAAMFTLAAPRSLGAPWICGLLAVLAIVWVALQPVGTSRDDTLPALAVAIAALGVLLVARLSPDLAAKQLLWLGFSLVLAIAAGPAFTRFRVLSAYTYVWIVFAIVLFVLLALFGQEVNGAKLWIRIGGAQFEPVEVIKLLVVLFMASYLAGTADVIERTKPWSLRANAKYLGPLFIGWGVSMAILVLERDLGMATLLLATFAAMLYVATRRIDLIVGCTAIFAGAIWWAATHYHYVQARIAVWRDPFRDPYGAGYQAMQSLFSLAAGGLFGTGYHAGRPDFIPDVATDYVYAAYTEEWGAVGAIVLCAAFLALILRMLAVAGRQPDLYAKLLATGLAATLGFQVVIIVGGVLRLFPLTGITLPFVSYGGSSLVTNFLLVALVWAISGERRRVAE
jgi:cell division protein FtsW (lipid II flippase)